MLALTCCVVRCRFSIENSQEVILNVVLEDNKFINRQKDKSMKNIIIAASLTLLTIIASTSFANTAPGNQLTKATATEHKMQKVNINKASLEQLEALPGLGKSKAQAVIDYIANNGAIKNSEELTKVKGIGNKLAAKLTPYLSYN